MWQRMDWRISMWCTSDPVTIKENERNKQLPSPIILLTLLRLGSVSGWCTPPSLTFMLLLLWYRRPKIVQLVFCQLTLTGQKYCLRWLTLCTITTSSVLVDAHGGTGVATTHSFLEYLLSSTGETHLRFDCPRELVVTTVVLCLPSSTGETHLRFDCLRELVVTTVALCLPSSTVKHTFVLIVPVNSLVGWRNVTFDS